MRTVRQITKDDESQRARSIVRPERQKRRPSDSDADEKPPPCTVKGVPPSASAELGERYLTPAAGWYVYHTPLGAYCWPFIESSTAALPDAWKGDVHSS